MLRLFAGLSATCLFVPLAAAQVSYLNGGQEALEGSCSPCHAGQGAGGHDLALDFAQGEAAAKNPVCEGLSVAECAVKRAADGSMPPTGAGISATDLATLENWLEDGLLECIADSECDPNESCSSDGRCVPVSGCSSDSDCLEGGQCVDGACQAAPTACKSDSECQAGQVCTTLGVCADVAECQADSECLDGEVCSGGTCVADSASCVKDSDCLGNATCSEGFCVSGDACAKDSDCDSGEVCGASGVCESTERVSAKADDGSSDTETATCAAAGQGGASPLLIVLLAALGWLARRRVHRQAS